MTVDQDAIVGGTTAAAGTIGLTIQLATQVTSLLATVLNVLLALGGLYLLWLRVRKARRETTDNLP